MVVPAGKNPPRILNPESPAATTGRPVTTVTSGTVSGAVGRPAAGGLQPVGSSCGARRAQPPRCS